jgi:FixJ family two-component response regulator
MKTREDSSIEGALVAVVDDDESVRESLPDLLAEFGFKTRAFASAEEFLESGSAEGASCLILDIAMPHMSGMDLQRELRARGNNVPIIFITAKKDESVRRQAMEQGAVGFLLKPFSDTDLQRALDTAFRRN